MNPGKIIFLNGTSSSGKTSILHALQDAMSEPYLDAGIDKFIWMLPERYLERPLWDDVLGLATTAGETGHRLMHGMHETIATLSKAGLNVVADHVLVEQDWLEECITLFADLPAYLIGIRCPLEVLVERERSRKNRTLGQAAAQFPLVHRHGTYDLEVDTSVMTVDQCAQAIKTRVESAEPPMALRTMAARS
jgi:chloramphenicol 3-O phosphotransferase